MSQWNRKNEALKCLTCFSLKIYPFIYFLWFSAGLLLPQPLLFKIQLLVVTIFGLVLLMLMGAEITGSWSKGDWPTDAKKPGLAGQRAVSGSRWGALESSRVGIRMDLRRSTRRWNRGRSDAIWARDLHQEPCQEMMAWDTGLAEQGLPWWLSGKVSDCQCSRCKFNPWVGKIPWRRKWRPTPVFSPGKSHGQRSLVGYRPRDLGSQTRFSNYNHHHH